MARKPKGEVARSETLAIRLDPRTRYMLELAGKIQHRTLSSVVEWMINNSLKDIPVDEKQTLHSAQAELWDIDESDRLLKLAFKYPSLLSFDEQKIWKLIREYGYFWRGKYADFIVSENGEPIAADSEWIWTVDETTIYSDRVRVCWEKIKRQALTGDIIDGGLPGYHHYLSDLITEQEYQDQDQDYAPKQIKEFVKCQEPSKN